MAIELSEYDVGFAPITSIKVQALSDFMQEITRTTLDKGTLWKVYMD